MKSWFKKFLRVLPDEWYIQLQYFHHFHRFANLKNPQTFNEKLQWLKLHDRNPLYTTLVDKYAVKKWVADKIGEQYIIPTLAVWQKAEDIDFDKLPNQFVLKVNHDSGGLVICHDKSKLDKQEAVAKLARALKNNGYWYGREWPYKNVKPCIIAEKYMEDNAHHLNDYKFFCFNGKAKFILFGSNRFEKGGLKVTFYDTNWQKLPFARAYHSVDNPAEKPSQLPAMCQLAEQLARQMPFARIDFYVIGEQIYFGEITLYPASGMEGFNPAQWDKKIGDLVELPEDK
ncbi:MAG: hypothetical protein J6U96_01485 [Elusimicrobiaceae bacterium]|nr:hypothetical protein [Elusimicrobiaceae bacterium]